MFWNKFSDSNWEFNSHFWYTLPGVSTDDKSYSFTRVWFISDAHHKYQAAHITCTSASLGILQNICLQNVGKHDNLGLQFHLKDYNSETAKWKRCIAKYELEAHSVHIPCAIALPSTSVLLVLKLPLPSFTFQWDSIIRYIPPIFETTIDQWWPN